MRTGSIWAVFRWEGQYCSTVYRACTSSRALCSLSDLAHANLYEAETPKQLLITGQKITLNYLLPNTIVFSLKQFWKIAVVLKEKNAVESKLLGFSNLKGYITFVSKVKMKVKMALKSEKTWSQTHCPYVDWKIYILRKVFQGFYFRKLILKSCFDDDDNNDIGAQTFSFRDVLWEQFANVMWWKKDNINILAHVNRHRKKCWKIASHFCSV